MIVQTSARTKRGLRAALRRTWKGIKRHPLLYLILLPPLTYIIIFQYMPMYGLQLAFKDFKILQGIEGSQWVGLEHFRMFIKSYEFKRLMTNTVSLSVYAILAGLLPPMLLAIGVNECQNLKFKKSVQFITYAPYFLSTVILVGVVTQVFSYTGIVNTLMKAIGLQPRDFLGSSKAFRSIYVWSGVWQTMGYNSILYIATLASVPPELYEAARVDGANIWHKIWYIDVPTIIPTMIILLILNSASVLNIGFEKAYLLQNPLNMSVSDIISTYVYRIGLVNIEYDYSTAVGLFQSLISLVLITIVNAVAKRFSEVSLW